MKFRKKPVVIEAEQVTPDNITALWGKYGDVKGLQKPPTGDPFFWIKTLEGNMMVSYSDWIITGIEGEVYPCKDSIFRATYEAVE